MTQGTNINTALGLILPATAVSHSMGGTGSTYVALSDITDPDFVIKGNYSRELHRLADTELVTFFGTTANPMHTDGEGLGIWFEEIIDSDPLTFGGRRQSTPDTAPAPNTAVTASKLFLTTIESSKIHGAIPLCRRIGTYLVFVDGTVVGNGQTVKFGQKGTEIVDIFALLADQAGADAGNTLIGCDAVTDTPLSLVAGTQRAQTVELLGDVNDLALEIDDLREDRVYSYNLDAADPQKMISTGLWVEPWAFPGNTVNIIPGGAAKTYRDIKTIFTATGESRLIIADNTNLKFEVWNPRTLALVDTSDVLSDDLPAGSFDIQSICTDGVSVYATIRNITPSPDEYYIQAWDIATWGVKAGWSTTGTKLTSTGNLKDFKCIMANATRIAVINTATAIAASTSPLIEIINIATGGITGVGAGNSTPTGSVVDGACIASDGTYVYFGVRKSGNIYICNASINNPAVSSGGTGIGGSLGVDTHLSAIVSAGTNIVAFFNYAAGFQVKGDVVMLIMSTSGAFLDTIYRGLMQATHSLGADAFPIYNIADAVFDGLNVWAFVDVDLLGTGLQAALFKLDVSKLCRVSSNLDVCRTVPDLNPSIFMLPNGYTHFSFPQMGMTFDGRDIWTILDQEAGGGHPLAGNIYRLPLALLRH